MGSGAVVRPRDRSELLSLQETLYRSRNPTRRWLHTTRRDWIELTLRRLSAERRPRRALEVGPGSGVYLPLLAQLADEVVATDVQDDFLVQAERLRGAHANISVVRDDIGDSLLPRASFDLILCSEVIEHLPDSLAALHSMRRLLSSDGALVISTPQRYSPLEVAGRIAFLPAIVRLVRRVYREPVLATGHINLLTARDVERQLRAAGLRVVEEHRSGFYLPLIAEFGGRLALRLEQNIERRLRSGRLRGLLWTQYYVVQP